MSEPKDITANLRELKEEYQQPLRWVMVVAGMLAGIFLLALFFFRHGALWSWPPLHRLLQPSPSERLLFICYVFVLVAMWLVYFVSEFEWMKIKTLRTVLSKTSEIFGRNRVDASDGALAEALRDKARTSVTMMAMLTAAATLMFSRSLDLVHEKDLSDYWQLVVGYCSAAAAIIAAICFVISADSYDVMYNLFGNRPGLDRSHMLQLFYNSTRNTRYYGVMFLLYAVCLFAGARSPVLGAVAVGLVVSIGWSHWFPSPALIGEHLKPKTSWPAVGLRALFIFFPIVWPALSTQIGFS